KRVEEKRVEEKRVEERKQPEEKKRDKKKGFGGVLRMNFIGNEVVNFFNWRKSFLILIISLFFSIALVFGAYWGVLWWGDREFDIYSAELAEKQDFQEINQKISDAKKKIDQEIIPFEKKLNSADKLIDSHIYWSNFFKLLEEKTFPVVYFQGFSGDLSGEYNLSAQAKDMEAVEAQVDSFLESEYVEDAWVESVALQASETGDLATFQINLRFKTPYIFNNYQ
ncbi:hypothetical protein K8R62_01775, partial [bacterium]|nr:hypothetical protein [bacterium]